MGNQERTAKLNYLLQRYRTNTCTRAELEELFLLMKQEDGSGLLQGLQRHWEQSGEMPPTADAHWDLLFHAMMKESVDLDAAPGADIGLPRTRRRLRGRRRRLVVLSLCFLLLLGGGAIVHRLLSGPAVIHSRPSPVAHQFKNDVQPGGNKAVLTLADGSSIVLDSATDGTLSQQGNTRVLKLAGGRLAYHPTSGTAGAAELYNTISTPRGGQYQIELPDGSKVWLDASSSLRFPTAFTGHQREVQLCGEAYFEVAGNPLKPFAVSVYSREPGKGDAVEKVMVLGTQFNVMAYADESLVKTTLIEGAVRLDDAADNPSSRSSLSTTLNNREISLKPGEQAQHTKDHLSGFQVIADADVEAAVAWKNGYFDFNKADIQTIMRQLSRWYDVEVSFRGGGRDRVFFGGIQRNLPLSSTLRILERSGVLFSIDGKKVVVDL